MRAWLKEKRLMKGMTHSQVAEMCKIDRAYYTMIESGYRNPSVITAQAVGEALNFDWTIFFENQCNESKHYEGSVNQSTS